ERLAIRPALCDCIKQDAFFAGFFLLDSHGHTSKQIRVVRIRKNLHFSKVAEMCHRTAEMEQRTTATEDQLAVVGIGNAAGAGAIGVQLDFVVMNMEKPGLGVVVRRSEHSVAKEKFPFVLSGTVVGKIFRRDVPGSEWRLVRINCS